MFFQFFFFCRKSQRNAGYQLCRHLRCRSGDFAVLHSGATDPFSAVCIEIPILSNTLQLAGEGSPFNMADGLDGFVVSLFVFHLLVVGLVPSIRQHHLHCMEEQLYCGLFARYLGDAGLAGILHLHHHHSLRYHSTEENSSHLA